MGNYSYLNEERWTNYDEFLKNIAPYYNTPEYIESLPEKYRELSKEQKVIASLVLISNEKFAKPRLHLKEDRLHLCIDGWKIQGYWYEDFCLMLEKFHELGLRGFIDMTEEQDQDFIIELNDKGIEVEVFEPAEFDYSEDRDEYTITKESKEMASHCFRIQGGKLQ